MINIFNLHKSQRVKKRIERNIIKKRFLEKCITKIKLVAEKAETQLLYTIPNIVIGIPLYDKEECAQYLVKILKAQGFMVVYMRPNLILISWDKIPKSHYPKTKRRKRKKRKSKLNPDALIVNQSKYKNINDFTPSKDFIYNKSNVDNLEQSIKDLLDD